MGGVLEAHFAGAGQQRQSVLLGMWIFLATEVLFFGALFLAYFVARAAYPEAFAAAGRELHLGFGAANTAVLLTSSYTMALAVRASHLGARRGARRCLLATVLLGAVFLLIKAAEYRLELEAGVLPLRSLEFVYQGAASAPYAELFFSLYLILTGVHALHLAIGIGLVAALTTMAARRGLNARLAGRIEVVGLYWHFVDIVWIFLFPVLYLIDR